MDIASIIGLVLAFGLMIYGMGNGNMGMAALPIFAD